MTIPERDQCAAMAIFRAALFAHRRRVSRTFLSPEAKFPYASRASIPRGHSALKAVALITDLQGVKGHRIAARRSVLCIRGQRKGLLN